MKKNKLSKQQVLHIAKLANLKLSKKEIIKFQKQLGDILDYIDVLDELNTRGIKTTSRVTGLENVFRKDKVEKCLSFFTHAPRPRSQNEGYFKIKAIFD